MRGYHGRERTEAWVLRGGRLAGGYGRTYTPLYWRWIYGAPHVDMVVASTLSGVAWWGRYQSQRNDALLLSRQTDWPYPV
jgi:hypothetical protein